MDMAISPMVNNKQRYREVATDLPNLPVFFNPWYLDAACGDQNWEVCISQDNGGRIQGVLPYFRSSKYGISHITMPLLLPYLGPWVIHPQNPSKQATRYSYEKKVLKTKTLEEIWPQYVKTIIRFERPHHFVDWKGHFKHSLVRKKSIDWNKLEDLEKNFKLKKVKEIKNKLLQDYYKDKK